MANQITIDDILDKVRKQVTVAASVLALVKLLVAAKDDPAKLQAIAAQLDGSEADLEAAVLAGTPQAPAGPTVTPNPLSLAVGATQALAAADSTGADETAACTYTSADPTIATVDASGVATGVAAGSTTITVKDAAGNPTDVPTTVA